MPFESIAGSGIISQETNSQNPPESPKATFTRGSIKYDSPFMDMTSTFLPDTIKSLFRFIAAFVLGDGLASQCITKLSEYPITKLIYNDDSSSSIKGDKTVDFWKDFLEKKIKILRVLKQSGMDLYAYGNSIVSINYPFRRVLQCTQCKNRRPADGGKYSFKNYKFYGKCPKCGYDGEMKAFDINTKEIGKMGLVFWDLLHIDIKYNSITGDHFYYYTIPKGVATMIQSGDLDIINTTRLEVIKAVEKNKQLKLVSTNVFHLKRAAPQYIVPSQRGWGVPVVMPVLKDIFHNKILKKGNEMIAFDHIVPLRILFPQATGDVSPHATMNLSGWRSKIEDEIRKWRTDPNYISIVPIPLGIQNLSGDHKILSVTPEIRATEDAIITGLGIIPEIIKGGASWSGSNVSLRVVENSFLNHREEMLELLEWIVDNVSRFLDRPKISIKMSDFKMADDLQKKQLILSASQGGSEAVISRTTAAKELGFNPDEEYSFKKEEIAKFVELTIAEAIGRANAHGEASLVEANWKADADESYNSRMQMRQREAQEQASKESEQMHQQNAQQVAEEIDGISKSQNVDGKAISIPVLIITLTDRFARLARLDKEEFKIRMLIMKNSMPVLYSEIYNNLKEMNVIEADLLPDLELAQKYTPGQLPEYTHGETHGQTESSYSEQGLNPSVANNEIGSQTGNIKPLPEARPPVSKNSSI